MKTRTMLIIAALAAFTAGPASAGNVTYNTKATYQNHPGASYGPSHNNYNGAASNYGPSPYSYNGTQTYSSAPKTGNPTVAYTSPTALSTAVAY